MNKTALQIIIWSTIIAGFIIVLNFDFSGGNGGGNNVEIIDGKQIITIKARGGYSPKTTTAKANVPTIIKMETNGTYDCSSTLVIPDINFRANLVPSGVTDVEIFPQKEGAKLNGLCAMGMYNFTINFI